MGNGDAAGRSSGWPGFCGGLRELGNNIVAGELKSFNVAAGAGEGLDAAVKDGVNVISFSIDAFDDVQFNYDFIDIATYKAMECGFFVSATAGNVAPTISSVGNDTPSMLTVTADGVNVISFSIDASDDEQFNYDFIDIATYKAMERGIFVSAAAGNAALAISSMGNGAPWMLTVAAGTTVKLGNGLTGGNSFYM
ncbi:hypothetical protein ACQ4PT_034694 [Festuca glaucescens]